MRERERKRERERERERERKGGNDKERLGETGSDVERAEGHGKIGIDSEKRGGRKGGRGGGGRPRGRGI